VPDVLKYCHITNNAVYLNGRKVFGEEEAEGPAKFTTAALRHFEIRYPKFHKMDEISRLGFLAAEMLFAEKDIKPTVDTGIILSNASATRVTDTAFQRSIPNDEEFYPSPSVFVYTLPNIMIGEISIRHQIRGEQAFFIFERFNAAFLTDYINLLIKRRKVNNCLGGWVEQSQSDYMAFMYLVVPEGDQRAVARHKAEELNTLFETIEKK
jgi:hypothetical protein